jgi:hypothetical protein
MSAKRPPSSETQPRLLLVEPTTPSSPLPPPFSGRSSTPHASKRKPARPTSPSRSLNSIGEDPTKPLPRRLQRQLAAAAEHRRRSGRTIEERVADLSAQLLATVKHYPADGMRLVEFCEELADAKALQLKGPDPG